MPLIILYYLTSAKKNIRYSLYMNVGILGLISYTRVDDFKGVHKKKNGL